MMVRGQYAQLMAPGLHSIFVGFLDLQQRDVEYEHIFNIEESTSAFEDEVEFAGTGPMVEKDEGEAITYDVLIQGATQRFIHTTYALGIRCSFELFDDDQYGLIKKAPLALARSARFLQEQQAWNVFNNGFTTVNSIDGVSLFNTQHPLLGGVKATNLGPGLTNVIYAGGTFPNRPSPDMDPSITGLQLAINQFERMVDHQGFPSMLKPRHIITRPEDKWIWREILGSPHKPYVETNEVNPMLSEDMDFFVSHYLTTKGWFIVCEKDCHQLKFKWRKKLDQDFADDFDTKSLKETALQRFVTGPVGWYGTWGTLAP